MNRLLIIFSCVSAFQLYYLATGAFVSAGDAGTHLAVSNGVSAADNTLSIPPHTSTINDTLPSTFILFPFPDEALVNTREGVCKSL